MFVMYLLVIYMLVSHLEASVSLVQTVHWNSVRSEAHIAAALKPHTDGDQCAWWWLYCCTSVQYIINNISHCICHFFLFCGVIPTTINKFRGIFIFWYNFGMGKYLIILIIKSANEYRIQPCCRHSVDHVLQNLGRSCITLISCIFGCIFDFPGIWCYSQDEEIEVVPLMIFWLVGSIYFSWINSNSTIVIYYFDIAPHYSIKWEAHVSLCCFNLVLLSCFLA